MVARTVVGLLVVFSAVGCVKIEGGFKYEYEGRVLREDGKTPAKNVAVRLARAEPSGQVNKVDTTDKASKASAKYNDKGMKRKTDSTGHYVGILETSHGWHYEKVMGANVGSTRPPEPPPLDEVILFVDEKGARKTGYRMKIPKENQAEATAGVRKVHVPDLLLPAATTKPSTRPAATQP
jgi:hypothetical protein